VEKKLTYTQAIVTCIQEQVNNLLKPKLGI
jgi:hypothetical protein